MKRFLKPNETGKIDIKEIADFAGITEKEAEIALEGLIKKGYAYKIGDRYGIPMKKWIWLENLMADRVN